MMLPGKDGSFPVGFKMGFLAFGEHLLEPCMHKKKRI